MVGDLLNGRTIHSLSYLLLRLGLVAKISHELTKTNIGEYSYERKFYNLRVYQ